MSWAAPAHATLAEDARRVEEIAGRAGLTLESHRTEFLDEGRTTWVAPATKKRCRSVVVLGARVIQFAAANGPARADLDELLRGLRERRDPRASEDEPDDGRSEARAGLLQLSGCDARADALEQIVVRMSSQRGALEILAFGGDSALPDVEGELGRARGPVAPRGDPGPPLSPAPLAARRSRAELSAREDGATNVLLIDAHASHGGAGEVELRAPIGCHRFSVFTEEEEGVPTDLDAELRDADTGERLDRDRGEAADARLFTCVGRTTALKIVFTGATESGAVKIHDALFPLPRGVPSHWGPRATGLLSAAIKKRLARGPDLPPIWETLGAQGSMVTSLGVEPGRCYLAAAALTKGTSHGLRLAVGTSGRPSMEEISPAESVAAVSFCSQEGELARVLIDAPGASIGWVVAIWPLGVTWAEGALELGP